MKSLHTIWRSALMGALGLLLISCEQKSSTGPAPGGITGNLGEVSLVAGDQELFYIPGTPIETIPCRASWGETSTKLTGLPVAEESLEATSGMDRASGPVRS